MPCAMGVTMTPPSDRAWWAEVSLRSYSASVFELLAGASNSISINAFWIHRNSAVRQAADKWIFFNDRFRALYPRDADCPIVIAVFLSGICFVGDNWMMRGKMIERGEFSRQSEIGRAAFARQGQVARGDFDRAGEWF